MGAYLRPPSASRERYHAGQLAISVPEFGFEDLPQAQHPLRPPVRSIWW
jgi:hypothetical protein